MFEESDFKDDTGRERGMGIVELHAEGDIVGILQSVV